MSRIFEALQRSQGETPTSRAATPNQSASPEALASAVDNAASEMASPNPQRHRARLPTGSRFLPNVFCTLTPTPEQRLVTLTDHNGPGAEMFRVLATRLAHMKNKRPLSKLLVSSAVVDEGKSVVAVNLAIALSQRPGERVLLMEADFRRPTASHLLSSTPTVGITEWHAGRLSIEKRSLPGKRYAAVVPLGGRRFAGAAAHS